MNISNDCEIVNVLYIVYINEIRIRTMVFVCIYLYILHYLSNKKVTSRVKTLFLVHCNKGKEVYEQVSEVPQRRKRELPTSP